MHAGSGCANITIWLATLLLWCPVLSYAEVSSDHGGPNGGSIRPGNDTDACSATNAGAIRYNTGNLWVCNGTAWSQLSSSAGGAVTDRIVSSTTAAVIANQDGGTVSLTLGGTAGAAYFHPTAGFVGPAVSATGAVVAADMTVQKNQNALTRLTVTNNTDAATAAAVVSLNASTGTAALAAWPATSSASGALGQPSGVGLYSGTSATGGLTLGTRASGSSMYFYTAGTEAMRIMPNNNVGIGTTSPGARLAVYSASQYAMDVTSPATNGTWLTLNNTSSGGIPWQFLSTGSGNGEGVGKLMFRNGSSGLLPMVIQANGNVGIGTTAPEAALHVSGTILLNNSRFLQVKDDLGVARNVVGTMSDGTVSVNGYRGSQMLLGVNGATYLYGSGGASVATMSVMQNGRVGIGYNIASSTLHVNGEVQPGSSGAACAAANNGAIRYTSSQLQYCVGTAWTPFASGAAVDAAGVSGSIQINSAGSMAARNDFYVDGNGSMVTPRKLFVGSTESTSDAGVEVGGSTGNRYAYIDLTGDATYNDYGLRIIRNNTGPNANSNITHRGTGILVLSTNESAPIVLSTSNTEAMRILPNNNVGIGTSAPTSLLHVAGTANFEGNTNIGTADNRYNTARLNVHNGDLKVAGASVVSGSTHSFIQGLHLAWNRGGAGGASFIMNQSGTGAGGIRFGEINTQDVFTENMRIAANGNVGIGTSNPGARLDVVATGTTNAIGGYASGAAAGVVGQTNSTSGNGVFGYNATTGVAGTLAAAGGYGVYCNAGLCGGANAWTNTSDARLKVRVQTVPETRGLAMVEKLRPVTFHWRDKTRDAKQGQRLGFIAQEVEKLYPELVTTDPSSTMKSLSYAELVVPLTKAVQELKADNDNTQRQLDELRREIRATRH